MIRRECRKLTESLAEHPLTFEPRPLVNKRSKVLALGSCFALRVKEWLLANGYSVLNEGDLGPYEIRGRREFDPRIYYNTFCIRYEFERVVGQFVHTEDDIWEPYQNSLRVYQDPYRRMLAGESREQLWQRIREVDDHMRRHILAADCVIITLGLTEVFFQQHNGRAICAAPGYCGGGGIGCEFRATEYPENYANVERVIEILHEVNPKAKVILTVSPVPLAATWSGVDHAIANTESKSTLRAVAGAIVRRFEHVHYFHSYELVMHADRHAVFKEDGRHVLPEHVAGIMRDFETAFVELESARSRGNEGSEEFSGSRWRRKGPHFIDLSSTCGAITPPTPAASH